MPKLKPQLCGRCGKKLTHATWVHSRWTTSYYCRDQEACGRRAKRRKREVAA